MKKKKICFVIPVHWAAFMGGAQFQAKCILDHLIKTDDYEIYYLARRVSDTFKSDDYEVLKIANAEGIRKYGYFFDTFDLLGLLKKIKPEIIYQRIACGHTGIVAYYARRNKCKVIWHVAHDQDVAPFDGIFTPNYLFRLLEKKFIEYGIRYVDEIVTQTKYQGELLLKNYNRQPTTVIPNFHPKPETDLVKDLPIKILWVANFKPVKRPEIFVKLAKDLSNLKNVKFQMIGSCGATNRSYTNILKEIENLDNLEYLGGKTQDEVNQYLSKAHIFVNTSEYEGFANTFIQAWMRKVPVVSLTVNPDNILAKYKVGYCSNSYENLIIDVKELINNNALRKVMGENAQNYAFENHSERNVLRLIKLF